MKQIMKQKRSIVVAVTEAVTDVVNTDIVNTDIVNANVINGNVINTYFINNAVTAKAIQFNSRTNPEEQ